jgi:hypothetical protein
MRDSEEKNRVQHIMVSEDDVVSADGAMGRTKGPWEDSAMRPWGDWESHWGNMTKKTLAHWHNDAMAQWDKGKTGPWTIG